MKLIWSKKLFFFISNKRKNKKIGHNILLNCRFKGKFAILNGICIALKNKKSSSLNSSVVLKRESLDTKYFINVPIYLSGALNFNVIGLTYGFKINSSKLFNYRIK